MNRSVRVRPESLRRDRSLDSAAARMLRWQEGTERCLGGRISSSQQATGGRLGRTIGADAITKKKEALRDRSGGRGWQGTMCTHRSGERGFLNSDTDTAPWSSEGRVSPSYLGVTIPLKEETQQAPFWKQDSMLSWTVDFWAICPVSKETTYQLENQTPQMEKPQGFYGWSLDSPLKEYPNYLCNRIES